MTEKTKEGDNLDKFQTIAFGLMLVLSHQIYAQNSVSNTNQTALAVKSPQCPSKNFADFLNAFTESVEIQKAFTKFPLKIQMLDLDSEPDPMPVIRFLNKRKISFPVIPSALIMKSESLSVKVYDINKRLVTVMLSKSDTDYKVYYSFRKIYCWELYYIEDWSL